jgi:DNA-directed RNA polymerase specialized sigma24 family protein
MEELSLKEIALVMKKNRVHVRVLLHRARLNLIKQLNPSTSSKKDIGKAYSAEENLLLL